ncbi:DnaJ domain-containing protein [Dipodascopsis tothii]|uniref:DnaJ domain-containing protein n=1 Tax=Dipodascopsis tothii TaxID=44089 RepID=UPI0034CDF91D
MASKQEIEEISAKYDFYDLLGLKTTADDTQIRKAYRKTALKYHPDKNSSVAAVEMFHVLSVVYEVLTDKEHKATYDAKVAAKAADRLRREKYDVNRRKMQDDLEQRERAAPTTTAADLRRADKIRRLKEQSLMLRKKRDLDIRRKNAQNATA